MSLQHLHLHVKDRAASEQFYLHWFEMKVARRGETLTFMHDDRDFLFALADDAHAEPLPAWFHFGMRLKSSADVVALCARMEKSGVAMRKPIYHDASLTSFRCADPDGHVIEVYWESPG